MIETLPTTSTDSRPASADGTETVASTDSVPVDAQQVNIDKTETAASKTDAAPLRNWGFPTSLGVALAVVVVAFGCSYAPNIQHLYKTWCEDPNYSHGFLVVPVALVILWQRWVGGALPRLAPSWWGWSALAAVLVLRTLFYERGSDWSETATLLPVIACLTLTFGGWPLLKRVWPAIVFLVFLFPLPPSINNVLSQPLQHLATLGSAALLKLTGLWVVAEGNVILVGADPLGVAAACNGLSMLMCLAATVAAITFLVPMDVWKRVVLLTSIIPVALISNILRITATAWCYRLLGADAGAHFAHDAAGWLMMPVALVLVGLELKLLSLLILTEEEITVTRPDQINRLRTHPA